MKELPIGLQEFEYIRNNDALYVDKTEKIYDMVSGIKKQFFLSRPRRFGKTILCWTLDAVFSGRKDLFEGLAIADSKWKWEKHPVIRLDMSKGDFSEGETAAKDAINSALIENAEKLGVELRGESLSNKFSFLIGDSVKKYGKQAVVIIDEYDNPLLSLIDKKNEFDKVRDTLRDFYKIVKASEDKLKFAFLTGITKFAKVSVFSALNNLNDITLDPRFADICGITQNEMEDFFAGYIDKYAESHGGKENYLKKLKVFYNGYRFSKNKLSVYNPYGLVKHFDSGEFNAYWFESGTPTYLIKLLDNEDVDILTFKGTKVTTAGFRKYDSENMDAVPMLYQAGYLTVVDYNEELGYYTLDYPNTEVRSAFADELAVKYLGIPQTKKESMLVNISEYLYGGDVESTIELAIKPFMSAIPNNIAIRNEHYFQTIFYIIFNMLGLKAPSEISMATGRIDAIVETPKFVYCFEFKLDKTVKEAMDQIDKNEYLTPYKGSGKTLFKIGVNFNYKERKIQDWAFEEVK
ncbi:MAG: ATP-binding protein [Chitinispirillales bacterium]|jgi:hypothetical protein|nr:ATP-binding protein [Chitinispirillales bacterium]